MYEDNFVCDKYKCTNLDHRTGRCKLSTKCSYGHASKIICFDEFIFENNKNLYEEQEINNGKV